MGYTIQTHRALLGLGLIGVFEHDQKRFGAMAEEAYRWAAREVAEDPTAPDGAPFYGDIAALLRVVLDMHPGVADATNERVDGREYIAGFADFIVETNWFSLKQQYASYP